MKNIENVSAPETTQVSGQEIQQSQTPSLLPENTIGGLERHESAALLPAMPPEKLEALREDIRENGLRVPIVLCNGKVLDGWQRYQICRELGMEPRFEDFVGEDPMVGFLSLNISRRHLEKSQLAVLAYKTQLLLSAETGSTSDDVTVNSVTRGRGRIRSKVAGVFGVSEGYIQQAKKLNELAPDLFDKVAAGTINLSEADTELKEQTSKGGATGNQSGNKSGEPSVQLRLKNLIEKVCKILNSLDNDDHRAVYNDIIPILNWAEDHELRSKEIEKLHPDAPEWADNLAGEFPLPKAA